jgi:hypothetical protein
MDNRYGNYGSSRWRKAQERLGGFANWIWGGLGLGGLVTLYLAAVANEFLPAPKIASDAVCLAREAFHDPAPGTHFTILISNLASDTDGRQTKLVRDVFFRHPRCDGKSRRRQSAGVRAWAAE